MTTQEAPPSEAPEPVDADREQDAMAADATTEDAAPPVDVAEEAESAERPVLPWTPRRIAVVGIVWVLATVLSAGLVCYGLGPLFEARQQHAQLSDMKAKIAQAVGAQESLFGGVSRPTGAPEIGSSVAVLQIPRLRLQQVIVEGADPKTTQAGPGHVPGTAGPGQPGNSVVVGRRYGFGAPFRKLASLGPGDAIIISTPQGQSLYRVLSITTNASVARAGAYNSTRDDRMTLISSASALPWEGHKGTVVVASIAGLPFQAYPQGGRTRVQDGRHGDPSTLALIILYGILFVGAAVVSTLLYRRWRSISTYVITAPIMIGFIVLAAEAAIRLLPAWT